MKLTKRILVVLAAVAILASCFVFASSAEAATDNIEDILEYYDNPQYVLENFDALTVGDAYSYVKRDDEFGVKTEFVSSGALIAADPSAADNLVLSYTETEASNEDKPFGYVIVPDEPSTKFVAIVRIRADKPENAAAMSFGFNVYATAANGAPVGENRLVSPLTLNFETGVVTYARASAVDASVFNYLPVNGVTVEAGKWYTVSFIMNCERATYSFSIQEDGEKAYNSVEVSLGDAALVEEFNAYFVSGPRSVGASSYIDDVNLFSGSFIRGSESRNEATTKALVELKALLETELDLETEVRIAEVFARLAETDFEPVAIEGVELEEAQELFSSAKDSVPATYEKAFVSEVTNIDASRSFSRRQKQITLVEKYMASLSEDQLSLNYDAVKAYKAEKRALDEIERDSLAYIAAIEEYDETSRVYSYILDSYDTLSSYSSRNGSYPGVYECASTFSELEKKATEIRANVSAFRGGVAAMRANLDFASVYAGYVEATAVYKDGVIHSDVDSNTVPGLVGDIAFYLEEQVRLTKIIEECEGFISAVNRASSAMYYATMKTELAVAELYLDDNIDEYVVEDEYPGIEEAKTNLIAVRSKVATLEAAAAAYVEAVAEISKQATFTEKRMAVEYAYALKESGNVIGIAGVAEANIALANADNLLEVLEGSSKTLIETVEKLGGTSLTLSERRELIMTAKNAYANAEPTYQGVSEAGNALSSYMQEYAAEVAAINASFSELVCNANTIAGAGINQSRFDGVIGVIRAIYAD